MKIIVGLSAILAVFAAIATISIWKSYLKSEMDVPNFIYAKASKLFIRDLYPKQRVTDLKITRKYYNELGSTGQGKWGGEIKKVEIQRDYGPPVPVRMYHPRKFSAVNDDEIVPVIMWLHGGGFVLGSAMNDDHKCFLLSKLSGYMVVSVDYRLAPENKHPAALQDAATILKWISTDIRRFGGDPRSIILAGESTGGTLAASLAAYNYDTKVKKDIKMNIKLNGLLLIYPPLQYDILRPSHFKNRNINGLMTLDQLMWFWSLYLGDKMQKNGCNDFTICPMSIPSFILKKFPPTAILLAKHDLVLDENLAFIKLLQENNMPVESLVLTDTVHGTWANFDYTKSYVESNIFIQEQLMMMGNYKKAYLGHDDSINSQHIHSNSGGGGSSAAYTTHSNHNSASPRVMTSK